jgi:RNA polymerase sigma-70 factor (ECF subfamily)
MQPPSADVPSSQAQEASVRAILEAGDRARAASEAIRLFGPEILRFLYVRLRDREEANDAFSLFCEDLWQGLADFAWRSSLRTWLFVLARHAAARQGRARQRQRARILLEGDSALFDEACVQVRTQTAPHLSTAVKQRVRALREQLDDDQQTLLVLRLDRGLPWRELAIVMGEATPDTNTSELERASARVRTRYQVAKKRLRELAIDAGLVTRTDRS